MDTFIIADNQDITKEGLISLIQKIEPDTTIVCVSSRENLQSELKNHPASVVILDYALFDFSSYEQMLNMKSVFDLSSWLLFSEELNDLFLRQALLCDDTLSVVMKNEKMDNIVKAIKAVSEYDIYLCDIANSVLQSKTPLIFIHDTLTATEKIVLKEIALGKMTKEIAYEKNLSFHTVNTHRKNIFRKLGVNNVHEAIKYAFRAGLIDIMEYYI